MRKLAGFGFILVIILLFVTPQVRAEQTASDEAVKLQRQAEKQAIIDQLKAEKKSTREAVVEEKKETMVENRKDKLQTRFNFRVQHIEAAIARLESIAARFETRLGKIGATRDVAKARANLVLAKTHIQQAKVILEKLTSAFTGVLTSDTPKQTYETAVKPLIKELFKQLSEAHQALKMGVGTVKSTATPSATSAVIKITVTPKVTSVPTVKAATPTTAVPTQGLQ